MKSAKMEPAESRITFITGTDTGVGKTLLTGLLLAFLRRRGIRALATKPFCTGSRGDARLLSKLQDNELGINQVNPFHYPDPVAPLVAGRKSGVGTTLREAVDKINALRRLCDWLLVEGIGGFLVPLGPSYSVRDLVLTVGSQVVIVAQNRIGAISHVLLTVQAAQVVGIEPISVVLMNRRRSDLAGRTNAETLRGLLKSDRVFELPYMGKEAKKSEAIKKNSEKNEKTLALIIGFDKLSASERARECEPVGNRGKKSQK